jgi:threonine dehydratase
MPISIEEFDRAIQIIAPFVKTTSLEHYRDNIYLKRESEQITGSFKWRGVLYSVMNAFNELRNIKIDESKPYYMVTQSTGNHGIAVIKSVHIMKMHFSIMYPDQSSKWNVVCPCIFGNVFIKPSKYKKMVAYLRDYGETGFRGILDCTSENYAHALQKRETFLLNNPGVYLSHGGKDIMTGYGSLAKEIMGQIPPGKTVTMITAIGAGGPIGIGAYFHHFPNYKLVVSQSCDFDAFVRSLDENASQSIQYNDCNKDPGFSDGIAVDTPELYALETARNLGIKGVTVDTSSIERIHRATKLGGSSCIALAALDKLDITSDIIVILDCEGNK